MKTYLLLLILLALLPEQVNIDSAARSLNNKSDELSSASDCPDIFIECPAELVRLDDTYSITVKIEGAEKDQKLTYHWTISGGEIKSGQGTCTLTVKLPDLHKKTFTAVVEVGGLPEGCNNKVSCSVAV